MKNIWDRWQANFLAGLAIVLPAVLTLAVVFWIFGTVSNFTDSLLVFLPKTWTHENHGAGPMYWYWRLFALLLALVIVGLIGRLARNYMGRKVIELVDWALLRIPLLNKLYSTIKQVNEAFSPSSKTSFKQVVLVQFPQPGSLVLGFVTGPSSLPQPSTERWVSVFVPTTPNPTSGFLLFLPESQLTPVDMSVADGIKYLVTLGSVSPDGRHGTQPEP